MNLSSARVAETVFVEQLDHKAMIRCPGFKRMVLVSEVRSHFDEALFYCLLISSVFSDVHV
jgi:hypothetical protein